MADRTITLKEPTAEEILALEIRFSGGVPATVAYTVRIKAEGEAIPERDVTTVFPYADLAVETKQLVESVHAASWQTAKDRLGFGEAKSELEVAEELEAVKER